MSELVLTIDFNNYFIFAEVLGYKIESETICLIKKKLRLVEYKVLFVEW